MTIKPKLMLQRLVIWRHDEHYGYYRMSDEIADKSHGRARNKAVNCLIKRPVVV